MIENSPRLLLLGYGCLGLSLLNGLLELEEQKKCQLIGVFRWSSQPKNKNTTDDYDRRLEQRVKKRAQESDLIDVTCPSANSYRFTEILEELKPDYLLFGSWGEIIKPHLLNRGDLKAVNCHPSLLPDHRGPNPYTSAIAEGEGESGVTFHWMTEGIDEGPILLQKKVNIAPNDTGGHLRAKCGKAAEASVPELISLFAQDPFPGGTPQDATQARYFPAIELEDGNIYWSKPPQTVVNRAQGLRPWLDSYSFLSSPLGKRTMVLIPRITVSKETSSPIKNRVPGTILSYDGRRIEVASSLPGQSFWLEKFSFYCLFFYLPLSLSRWFGRYILKPGKQFEEPLTKEWY